MKKIFMLAATAAIALSSCSKNEVLEAATPNDNPNTIGLSTGTFTTKAGETTTLTLNSDDNVIKIYSTDTDFGSNGTATFTYNDEWGVSSSKTWADVGFPLNLYSLNTGVNANGDLPITAATGAASAYTVKTTPSDQEDLVYYGAQLTAIPSNGVINATFKHALSRIMMQYQASQESNDKLYIASVKLVNVNGSATPTISNDATIAWSSASAASAPYPYYTATAVETALSASTTAASFSSTIASDMYIIPQETAKYTTTSNSYVEVVYRSTDNSATPINIVGYAQASQHSQYNETSWTAAGIKGTDPLYVKVAFPVSEVELEYGVYYNFVLDFDGSNIIVVEDGFVGSDGAEITTPSDVTDIPEEDATVNPDETTPLGLTVTVITWPSDAKDSDL